MADEVNGFPTPAHRQLFMDKVRLLGVKQIRIEFSGSGDSGNMEEPVFHDLHENDITARVKDTILLWPSEEAKWDQDSLKFVTIRHDEEKTELYKIVDQIANSALEGSGLDWYNNDGGQGAVEFTMTEEGMDCKLNVGVNHTETTEYDFEF